MEQVIILSFLLVIAVFSLLLKKNVVEYALSWIVIFNALTVLCLTFSKLLENSLLELLGVALAIWTPVLIFSYLIIIYKTSKKVHFNDVGDHL